MGDRKEGLINIIREYISDLMPGKKEEVRHDKPEADHDELFDRHMQQTDAADEDFDTRLPSNEPAQPKEIKDSEEGKKE